MTAGQVLEYAKTRPTGDWREYGRCESLLDEPLTEADYDAFVAGLTKILRV
jgi:hypothetical protein